MSTRFTKSEVRLAESDTLRLLVSASEFNDSVTKIISSRLQDKGYSSISPSLLTFLSILECGVNYGSDIARNLGVSRQMVAKTVRELSSLGFLIQTQTEGRQKEIHFTSEGEQLISDARALLTEIDNLLLDRLDNGALEKIITHYKKAQLELDRIAKL